VNIQRSASDGEHDTLRKIYGCIVILMRSTATDSPVIVSTSARARGHVKFADNARKRCALTTMGLLENSTAHIVVFCVINAMFGSVGS